MISPSDAFLLLKKLMDESAAVEMLFVSADESVWVRSAVSISTLREPTAIELIDPKGSTFVVLTVSGCKFEYADDRSAPQFLVLSSGIKITTPRRDTIYLLEKKFSAEHISS